MIIAERFTGDLVNPVRSVEAVTERLRRALTPVPNDRLPHSARLTRNGFGRHVIEVSYTDRVHREREVREVPLDMTQLVRCTEATLETLAKRYATRARRTLHEMRYEVLTERWAIDGPGSLTATTQEHFSLLDAGS